LNPAVELVKIIEPPRPPALRCGIAALGGVPHTGQVGVDHVLPALLGQLLGSADTADAGVGRDDVQPAQLGHPVVECLLQCAVVADVGLAGDDPAVQRLDFLDGLGEVVWCRHREGHRGDLCCQVDGDDVRALLGEPDRVAAALAARRAGDEGDFSCCSSRHHFLLA
jgi:hypothetical protein